MRRAVAVALLSWAAFGFGERAPLHPRDHYEAAFVDWMLEHKVVIPPGPQFVRHLENFIENSDHIERHNSRNTSYVLAHNRFSHMSFEEFQKTYLGWQRPLRLGDRQASSVMRRRLRASDGAPPRALDWVDKGAVSSVKDQGLCGSCYTFSATGAVEGAYALKHGRMVELSMQQVVDCDTLDGGCNGGEMTNVFNWIHQNGGLCGLEDYPYSSGETHQAGACNKCKVVEGTEVASWASVPPNSQQALMEALNLGPVSVAVGASRDWMFYKEGIFNGQCEEQLNHGILAVGFGQTRDGKYWKVKNSWGTGWGMDGYILLSRDHQSAACGILEDASYPVLAEGPSPSAPAAVAVEGGEGKGQGVGAAKGSASSQDCGGGTAVFDTITVSPADVQRNQLITLKASGVLNKPTTDGTYRLSVNYAGSELYSHTGSLCGTDQVTLPLNVGVINLYGFSCPATPGPVSYALDVKLPSIAPLGAYDIKITGADQDGVPAVCIDTKLNLA